MARRQRRARLRLAPKFVARRVMLALLVVAVVGVGAWKLMGDKPPAEETAPPETAEPNPSQAPETSEPQPSQTAEPEPEPIETTPEPEPEPEPLGSTSDWNLLLVNYANALPEDFSVDLAPVTETFQVDKRIADPLLRMILQAKEDGIDLTICSAYRSVERQEELFTGRYNAFLDQGYSEEEADALTVSETARPWTSEHHTGLAVDIVTESYQTLDSGFEKTPAFKWLDRNAHKYGFVLRFPKDKTSITQINYEPWHYRYVGVEHAAAIKEAGICLEEYLYTTFVDSLQPPAQPVGGSAEETGGEQAEISAEPEEPAAPK